jgi:hypothetical protein
MQLGFNCRACDDVLKKERGCTEKGIIPFELDGERVFRCPIKLVSAMSWQYVEAHGFYRKSILPNGQGYLRESKKYIEAMQVLDGEYARIEREEMEKAKR